MSQQEAMNQWKIFIADLRSQALTIVQILTNLGQIKEAEANLLTSILSANLETLSSPDAIGK